MFKSSLKWNGARQIYRYYSENATSDLVITQLKESDYGITVLGFNRPKQRNAFSVNLVKELSDALDDVSVNGSVKVLLIRSLVPGVFCAGYTNHSFQGVLHHR